MTSSLATVSYIGATILFILSLGGLSNPETSRRGNLYGMIGMGIAIVTTLALATPITLPSCRAGAASANRMVAPSLTSQATG